jgi:hypothetical protein
VTAVSLPEGSAFSSGDISSSLPCSISVGRNLLAGCVHAGFGVEFNIATPSSHKAHRRESAQCSARIRHVQQTGSARNNQLDRGEAAGPMFAASTS